MAPSTTTMKRIRREMADILKEDLGNITLSPMEDNMHIWRGSIPGPEGSVYEGGVFQVEITLPNDYPFSAPKAMLKTRIYHMNISEQGSICIDILKNNWSPALSLFKVMLSLSSLLTDPNPRDPLVPSIANEYMRNRKAHDTKARQWTELYAKPKSAETPSAPQPVPSSHPPPGQTAPGRGSRLRRAAAAASAYLQPTAAVSGGSSLSLSHPRASALSYSSAQAGPSRPHSQNTSGASTPIVIDDSDEEGRGDSRNRAGASTSRTKRKRGEDSSEGASGSSSRANRRNAQVSVLDISDDDAGGSGSGNNAGPAKRARTGRGPAAAAVSDDVIIIED
ncbi:hypothetical protein MD484_g1057, partial [Candolleomyces efflorescens]